MIDDLQALAVKVVMVLLLVGVVLEESQFEEGHEGFEPEEDVGELLVVGLEGVL